MDMNNVMFGEWVQIVKTIEQPSCWSTIGSGHVFVIIGLDIWTRLVVHSRIFRVPMATSAYEMPGA